MTAIFRKLALGAILAIGAASAAQGATWATSDRYGSTNMDGYTFHNNVWGSGGGPQTIWVNSASDWGVWANHSGGGIKSYPNMTKWLNRRISQIGNLAVHTETTVPSGGAWAATYDIWDVNHRYEIMLWLNYTGTSEGCGNVKPISYNWGSNGCAIPAARIYVGGKNWTVYRGSNGANQVFSFLAQNKSNTNDVDVKALLNWLRNNGWMGDEMMGEMQFGFEITSSQGGMNFGSRNFRVNFW